MNNYILVGRISDAIKDILIEDQLIIGENTEQKIRSEIGLILQQERLYFDTKTIGVESDDTYLFIESNNFLDKDELMEDKIGKILAEAENSFNGNNKLKLYFIVYNYSEELDIREKLNIKKFPKMLQDIIFNELKKTKLKKFELKNIVNGAYEIKYLMVNKLCEKDYIINIESRIRSLEVMIGTRESLNVKGYVFVANLCDIVEIFNDIGNELFEYNVRFGIDDKLDVAKEITKTIISEPEEFWFLNNGITMIIKDDDFNIKKSNSITLTYAKNNKISVINGAQTITTAAEVFYNKEYKIDKKETAKVMLRIIHITEKNVESNEGFKDLANKISLSLNRQKPIAPEDLAFTTDFVSNINSLWADNKNDNYTFKLSKRTKSSATTGVKLEEFARAISAYLEQNPGQARSQGRATLIKIENNDKNRYSFKSDAFKIEFSTSSDSTIKNLYKYYKPVNLAIYLSDKYQSNAEAIKNGISDKELRVVINYGKWFFIAYIIYVLNYENNKDFTKFEFEYPENTKDINDCIKEFSEIYADSIKENGGEFDSNTFKNSILYENFKTNGIKDEKKLESFKIQVFKTFKNDKVLDFTSYLSKSQVAMSQDK